VYSVIFGTGDDAGRQYRRQPEILSLVELRILKCSQSFDLVDQERWQAGFIDVESLGQDTLNLKRDGLGDWNLLGFLGWWPQPWAVICIVLSHVGNLKPYHLSTCRGLLGNTFELVCRNTSQRVKKSPLIRDWLQLVIQKDRITSYFSATTVSRG